MGRRERKTPEEIIEILVVDAMTGQDAVNVAGSFNDKIGIDGVIVTKAGRRYKRRCCTFERQ